MSVEEENVFRILAGQDAIQSLRCRIGWHRWTRWEHQEGNIHIGTMNIAKCYCADCGLPRIERPYSKSFKRSHD